MNIAADEKTKAPMRDLAVALGLTRSGSGNLSALWAMLAAIVNRYGASRVAAKLRELETESPPWAKTGRDRITEEAE